MSKTIAIIVGLVLFASLVLFSMTFTVGFHEVAIKTRFGKTTTDSIITEPGLKFRLPLFADTVTLFDKRLQLRETPLETIQTSDNQQVLVKAFMMWKIETAGQGPLNFYSNYSSIDAANQSLVDQFRTALNTGLSRYTFDDLIGPQSRLPDVEEAIKAEMMAVSGKGIVPVSVGISKLVLPAKTTTAVLARMNATRLKISESERQRGQAEATAIQSRAGTLADKIRAFADQRAAEIRAEGSKEAAKYLETMNQEKDLAIFLAWRDALISTLSQNTTVVIPTAFAPFHFLQLDTPMNAQGIPQPTSQNGLSLPTSSGSAAASKVEEQTARQPSIDETDEKGS